MGEGHEFGNLARHRSVRGRGFDEDLRDDVQEGRVMSLLRTFTGKLSLRLSFRNDVVSSYGWFSTSDGKERRLPFDLSALFGSGLLYGGLAWSLATGRCFIVV